MTAFVILAAGAGTRMGGGLHKALLPLAGQAVISRQIGAAPPGARIIVATGYRGEQIRDYLDLAHPGHGITLVPVPDWHRPWGGPGTSLLAARAAAGDDDLIFTTCDTLWDPDPDLWDVPYSWAAVGPVPAGTSPADWTRIRSCPLGIATAIFDKGDPAAGGDAYAGLARIRARNLPAFWAGLQDAPVLDGRMVTAGLAALVTRRVISIRRVGWTDTGDPAAYARAVGRWSGYDWSKPGKETWVLPGTGRVVKWHEDQLAADRFAARRHTITAAVPPAAGTRARMLAYEYVPGTSGYDAAARDPGLVPRLLDWARDRLWCPVAASDPAAACDEFYRVKTSDRIGRLPGGLQAVARAAVAGVDWDELGRGCEPVTFHGDFNLGNVIVGPGGGFTAIDWREDFAGNWRWGDRRYDLGKLAAGMIVHWGRARRGDFGPWPEGAIHLAQMGDWLGGLSPEVMTIAGLSLINCAPLHRPPLTEVLISRGAGLLLEHR